MADYTLNDLNAITAIESDDILHIRNTSGLDKKITWADLKNIIDPVGTIKMFDGLWVDNSTMVGWYACIAANAAQGCPNLENQFIKGSAPANIGDTGGSATHTLTTTEMPLHSHTSPAHVHTSPSHTHTITHTHASAAHSHTIAHTHTSSAHTHTLSSHTHVGAAHTHSITHDHGAASTGAHAHTQQRTSSLTGTYNGSVGDTSASLSSIALDTLTVSKTPSINLPSFSGTSGARSASTSAGPNTNTSGSTTPGATGGSSATNSGSTTPGSTGASSAANTGSTTPNDTGSTTPANVGNNGSGGAHNNEPQFYKLIFIRKCA